MSFKAVQQADGPLTRASKLGLPAQTCLTCLACPWLCVSLHKVSRVAPYRKYLEIPYGIAETVSALLKMQVSIQRPCSIYYNLAFTDKADFQLETLPFARCTHLGAAAEVVVLLFWVKQCAALCAVPTPVLWIFRGRSSPSKTKAQGVSMDTQILMECSTYDVVFSNELGKAWEDKAKESG
jgi:ferredoxin-like protein FixX